MVRRDRQGSLSQYVTKRGVPTEGRPDEDDTTSDIRARWSGVGATSDMVRRWL